MRHTSLSFRAQRGICTSLAALALLSIPATLVAQTPPDSVAADSARRLRPVEVTETRAATTAGGASAVVMKPTQLRASPAPLLEQALRESPFVHVRQNSRGEMEISVRGSDSRQAAVLVNGVPMSLGWDHRVDPSLVPVTGAQSLVIVRGLSTVLAGPNTLGGTIEISHGDATSADDDGRAFGGLGVDEHAANVATVGASRRWGSLSARGGVAWRQRDGFALAAGVSDPTATHGLRTNSDLRELDAFGLVRWTGSMGRSLSLTATAFDAERGVPPEEHISGPRLWRYPYHQRAVASLSGNAGTFETPFGYASLEGGLGVNAGRLRIDNYSDRTYTTVDEFERGNERTVTGRVKLTHTLPRTAMLATALTVANVDYDETLFNDPTAQYRQRLISTGAEVELPLGATSFSSGVVFDHAATPRTGGRSPQPDQSSIGWRAGLTRPVGAHWQLHGNASQRARFPALREMYSGALDRFVPNPDLKPETLLGFEAGATVDRAIGAIPDVTLQVNLFHHRLKDAVVRTTLPDPDNRFFRVNRDRIVSTGAEILGGIALGASRPVTITGDATVQRIRLHDPNAGGPERHAENNPEVRGMLELSVPLIAGIRGIANARYTGRQYCLNSDTDSEMTLAARTETGFAIERRFQGISGALRGLRALVALDNAGNTAIYDQCGLPQPGRTLRLMLTFQ